MIGRDDDGPDVLSRASRSRGDEPRDLEEIAVPVRPHTHVSQSRHHTLGLACSPSAGPPMYLQFLWPHSRIAMSRCRLRSSLTSGFFSCKSILLMEVTSFTKCLLPAAFACPSHACRRGSRS